MGRALHYFLLAICAINTFVSGTRATTLSKAGATAKLAASSRINLRPYSRQSLKHHAQHAAAKYVSAPDVVLASVAKSSPSSTTMPQSNSETPVPMSPTPATANISAAPASVFVETAATSASSDADSAVDVATAQDESTGISAGAGALVAGLKQKMAEMKQRRTNIASLQQALASDVSLLRESAALERVSLTQRDKSEVGQQVRQSEQIVKDTGKMLRMSRSAAIKDARTVLREQHEIRVLLDALQAEAKTQIQLFSGSTQHNTVVESVPAPPSDTVPQTEETEVEDSAGSADDVDDP